jgi:Do/DeqQ family serine protease
MKRENLVFGFGVALSLCLPLADSSTGKALAGPLDQSGPSLADVTEKALPSVVNVSSTRVLNAANSPYNYDPFFGEPMRRGRKQYGQSLGSGVIIAKKGFVLTNNHVVANAQDIKVSLADGREFEAELVGSDPKSDLALLKLKGRVGNLQPIAFGDSGKLRLGDVVLAIGNPFDVGQTVTMGIVSAKGRANVGIVDYEDFIQTDAAINPGNSGGALINMQGELVGINTAILSRTGGYQGIGFAIPSNMAAPIAKSLIEKGRVIRGWLGAELQSLDKNLAQALGVDGVSGAALADVVKSGPAAKAGLKRHDVIVRFAGQEIKNAGQLRNAIAAAGSGQTVEVEFLRANKRQTVSVRLQEAPEEGSGRSGDGAASGGGFGAVLRAVDKTTRKKFNLPSQLDSGVVIVAVQENSLAAALGLQPGDVILEVNQTPVKSAKQFSRAYQESPRQLALLIWRDGSTVYLAYTK